MVGIALSIDFHKLQTSGNMPVIAGLTNDMINHE